MDNNLEYLEAFSNMSETIKELAEEKNNKNNSFKNIIVILIIANIFIASLFSFTIGYFVYNVYNYDYTISNTNTITNTNGNNNKINK
jgi:C4-dicarboxylate transporter